MPIPDGDKASEHLLLQKMIPTAGIFCLKEGDNYDRRKKEKTKERKMGKISSQGSAKHPERSFGKLSEDNIQA